MRRWEYYLGITYLFVLVIFLKNSLLITHFIAVAFVCRIVMNNEEFTYELQRLKKSTANSFLPIMSLSYNFMPHSISVPPQMMYSKLEKGKGMSYQSTFH